MGAVMSKVLADIYGERLRQQSVEGWTPEHDDDYLNGELATAAAYYAIHAGIAERQVAAYLLDEDEHGVLVGWPWGRSWFKPKTRRFDLIRAAALLVAEIERLDRADNSK